MSDLHKVLGLDFDNFGDEARQVREMIGQQVFDLYSSSDDGFGMRLRELGCRLSGQGIYVVSTDGQSFSLYMEYVKSDTTSANLTLVSHDRGGEREPQLLISGHGGKPEIWFVYSDSSYVVLNIIRCRD